MSHLPSTAIFRQNAIDSLNTIDDVAEELQIIGTKAWVWLLASVLVLVAVVIWGFFGVLSLTVETQGMVLTNLRIAEIEANNKSAVLEHHDNVDDLHDLYTKKIELFNHHYITRIDLRKAKEEYLAAKTIADDFDKAIYIPMIEKPIHHNNTTARHTSILAFVRHAEGKKILPGMSVNVLPATASVFDHGYLSGTVSSISAYPISKQLAYSYLQNNSLVDTYFSDGAPFLVKILLENEIQPGTAIVAKINYKTCSPFQLLTKNN